MKLNKKCLIVGAIFIIIGCVCTISVKVYYDNKEKEIAENVSDEKKLPYMHPELNTRAVYQYGDRYQMVRINTDTGDNIVVDSMLFDEFPEDDEPFVCIEHKITRYYEDYKSLLYSVGEDGYTKLDYKNNNYIQSKNIEDFDSEDRKIFNELMDKKSKVGRPGITTYTKKKSGS